jgi:hypothetical protein
MREIDKIIEARNEVLAKEYQNLHNDFKAMAVQWGAKEPHADNYFMAAECCIKGDAFKLLADELRRPARRRLEREAEASHETK